jgi:hypothetical protein
MINKRDKNSSGIEAESKQVAATLEVAQPKPNTSAAPTAAGSIAQSVTNKH